MDTKIFNRRDFMKTAMSGVTVMATTGFAMNATAADDISAVMFAKDLKKLQPGVETSHTPSIKVEKIDSTKVSYGKTPVGEFYKVTVDAKHETTNEHFIFQIDLYINGKLVAEHKMNMDRIEASLPYVVFVQRLKAGDELLAVTFCNKHGLWGNKVTVV